MTATIMTNGTMTTRTDRAARTFVWAWSRGMTQSWDRLEMLLASTAD